MHDHNLDDLIIENIEPKNSKLKSFLTIIALLIVILIIAIVLTKILLKTPQNNDLVFEQESAELIAPELKLKETPKPVEVKNEPVLPNIVKQKPKPAVVEEKKPEIVKETTVIAPKVEPKPVVKTPVAPKVTQPEEAPELSNITQQEIKAPAVPSSAQQQAKDAADRAYWESVQAKRKAEQEAIAEKKAEEKAKESLQVKTPVIKKLKPIPKQISSETYYVQVGAYRLKPSSRFLSVIQNNGYKYFMTKPNSKGIKRLLIGPFKGKESVDRELIRIKDRIHKRAFVVKR